VCGRPDRASQGLSLPARPLPDLLVVDRQNLLLTKPLEVLVENDGVEVRKADTQRTCRHSNRRSMTTLRHARSTKPGKAAPSLCSVTYPDYKSRLLSVSDLMEPLRPLVDRKLIQMISSRSFAAGDFFLHPSCVVKTNPKLARYVASEIRIDRERLRR
jgi:hypothetical protein